MTPTPLLGTMRFGAWGAHLSPAAVADLIEAGLDAGIDTLDLADIFGDHTTNALVGAAFAARPGLRARCRLVAKVGIVMPRSPGNARGVQYYDLSPGHLSNALAGTLRDLGTDHVDRLMLHRQDPCMDAATVAAWVQAEQARGTIGAFGVSNFDAEALARFDGLVAVAAHQLELSLAHALALTDGSHAASVRRGAEVQAWSPLGGGGLLDGASTAGARLAAPLRAMAAEFDTDPASLLLRWVASVPGTRVVLGTARAERLREAVAACAAPLTRDAWFALWEAARGHPAP